MKDLDRVALTYHDSRNPGRISLIIDTLGRRDSPLHTRLNLSPQDAVELSDRLLTAVRSEGYDLTARRRKP